jgi:hypothetical protein
LVRERRREERGRLAIRDKRQGKRVTRHALYMRFTCALQKQEPSKIQNTLHDTGK